MAAGSIIVDLLMRTGTFETDTARAGKALNKLSKDAEAMSRQFKASFGGNLAAGFARDIIIGLGSIPGRFVDIVKGAIDAGDQLNDLSKKTGIAADTLGGIAFAAQQAGGDLASVTAGAGKLNKALAEAAAGNKEASEAFAALGISVKDVAGNTKLADVALAEIADKFASYADGPEKVALALKLFGKAGADMIPILNEGGAALLGNIAYFKRYSGVTVETAKAADAFNDTLTKVHLLQQAFGNNLASQLLPLLQTLAGRFLAAKEQGDGFAGIAKSIAGGLENIAIAASFVVSSIGAASAKLTQFVRSAEALATAQGKERTFLDPFGSSKGLDALSGQLKAFSADAKEEIDATRKSFTRLRDELKTDFNDPTNFSNEGRNRTIKQKPAPRLPAIGGAAGPVDDPTKKLLDNQLRAFQKDIDRERELFQTRNDFIELYNSQNLLSLKDYYSARKVALDEATAGEIAGIDKQIAALEAHQRSPKTTKVDAAADEGKLIDLREKRAKVEQDADRQALLMSERQRFSAEELAKQFQSVNAQVLELGENFAAAAAVKFDLQFDALSKTFTANGNAAGLEAIKTLRAAAIAQGAFQKASLDAGRTLTELQRQEERIGLAVQTGALTSLEALARTGEARRAQIPIYEAEVQALEAIAKASGSLADKERLDEVRLALDKLKASADPLAASLNKTFGDDFNDSLTDFVTGTKSAADAFKAFSKSVLNDILKMGTKSITESIFGGSGGVGGFISSLFSTSNASASGSGLNGLFRGLSGATATPASQTIDPATVAARAAETAALSDSAASLSALTASSGAAATELSSTSLAVSGLATVAGFVSTALTTLAASAATSSSSSLVSGFASVAGISGGRASGGPVGAGQTFVVGERGPEILHMGAQSGTVTANNRLGTQNINVTVQGAPGQSRDALLNQGATLGLGIQKAMARNT